MSQNEQPEALDPEQLNSIINALLKELHVKWEQGGRSFKRPTRKRVEKMILKSHTILESAKEEDNVSE